VRLSPLLNTNVCSLDIWVHRQLTGKYEHNRSQNDTYVSLHLNIISVLDI